MLRFGGRFFCLEFSTNEWPGFAQAYDAYSHHLVPKLGKLIAGDWSQVMLGLWSEVDLLVNPFDSTAYARGGVLVRAMATCDIAVRHPTAFVFAEDIAL